MEREISMKKQKNHLFSALLLSIALLFILSACSEGKGSSSETNSEWGLAEKITKFDKTSILSII